MSDRLLGIERAARGVLDKIAAGGNGAVTVEDYRGFATDILWLLGQLAAAEVRAEAAERVVEAARNLNKAVAEHDVYDVVDALMFHHDNMTDALAAYDKRQNPDSAQPIDRMGIKVDGVRLRDLPDRGSAK